MTRRMEYGVLFIVLSLGRLGWITTPARADATPAPRTRGAPASSRPESPLRSPAPLPAPSPHGPSVTDDMSCSACHSTASWTVNGSGQDHKFDHARTGFPLTGVHVNTPCAGCHTSTRMIKRTCSSCHEDAHGGRLSQSCDNCHNAVAWKATRPVAIHRFTRFPLTGMHVLADCTQCHRRASEQQWTDAPTACFACHENDYRRPNLFPVHVGSANTAALPRDCSLCHQSMAWVPALDPRTALGTSMGALTAAPPNHDMRFPITFGPHRTASCSDCHASEVVPRAVRCIGCHSHDPTLLMQQHRQPVATDGAACLGCHIGGARR